MVPLWCLGNLLLWPQIRNWVSWVLSPVISLYVLYVFFRAVLTLTLILIPSTPHTHWSISMCRPPRHVFLVVVVVAGGFVLAISRPLLVPPTAHSFHGEGLVTFCAHVFAAECVCACVGGRLQYLLLLFRVSPWSHFIQFTEDLPRPTRRKKKWKKGRSSRHTDTHKVKTLYRDSAPFSPAPPP